MKQKNGIVWLWISGLVFLLDQWTKNMASESLQLYVPHKVTEFFNLTLMHNKGVAFSLLANHSGWQRYFLAVVAIIIVIWLMYWLYKNQHKQKLQNVALAFVIGGAFGNIYDRVVLGYVVDFIELHYQGYYWPAFNVADSAICFGAFLLIVDAFKNKEGSKEENS